MSIFEEPKIFPGKGVKNSPVLLECSKHQKNHSKSCDVNFKSILRKGFRNFFYYHINGKKW